MEETVAHRKLSIQINSIDEPPAVECNPTPAEEEAALETFLQFFCRPDERETWALKVARALAETALERLRDGKQRAEFNSANVAEMVGHTVAPEAATSWLSGIWTKLTRGLEQREPGMQDTIRQAGLRYYAWPKKTASSGGAGNSSTYAMDFIRLPEVEGQAAPLPPGGIGYVRDVTLSPAFWVRPLVEAGFALKGWRRYLFLGYGLGGLALVGCLLVLLWLVITTQATRLPSGEIFTLLLLAGMVSWAGYTCLRPFWRLIDLRIIMAPDALLSLRERGVQLEAVKEMSDDGHSVRIIRLVRYSGRCPICGEDVHLQDGEREFPDRLVGRCDEHPAEHVFSFDRHTKVGKPLR
ncbi:hypothetical protein [Cupriavidus sp. AcVe19-6a]|uniref:hypothetical protein n=1 Tax=Cupriavidus sp. AcVe19-6a TaxID=2821358 RepID=UPI001AE4A242|nr:hypothetical protein [Cupriavidus sp. AcVe19-6a]MBP0639118.1 hypothetical protein [Cupriavidus sp. AcVe19-6a]